MNRQRVIIDFPYKTIYKEDILKYLIINERKVMDYCVTCESFDNFDNNCGECIPCRGLKSALINIYIDPQEKDEDIKNTAYEILKSRFGFDWDINIKKRNKEENIDIITKNKGVNLISEEN